MRAVIMPVTPMPVLASVALEPMPPVERPRIAWPQDGEAQAATGVTTPALRKATVVVRHQPVRVAHLPHKQPPRNAVRTATRKKSPYVVGKAHYPYVRPKEWGPGYPAS